MIVTHFLSKSFARSCKPYYYEDMPDIASKMRTELKPTGDDLLSQQASSVIVSLSSVRIHMYSS